MNRVFLSLFILIVFSSCTEWSSCESFNIDSYEIRTGLDIPKVSKVDCFSDENIRISFFNLDYNNDAFLKSYQSPEGYIHRYQFTRSEYSILETLQGNALGQSVLLTLNDSNEYFVREGKKEDKSWKTILVKDKGLLIAEMQL